VPDSHVVLRCFLGGAGQEHVLQLSDGQLLAEAMADLEALLGWTASPAFVRIRRWPRSMAQYTVGHGSKIREIRTLVSTLPGLQLAGNAYEGIGIPDCVRTGRNAARALAAA
jgi:oxygen-dependent protoporphyrinogen oxidase